ncbi:unnamed protein product [Blepharisma stoltei]|uniref:EGF-like domain-containing protein n=1 Tax=Blepharisma stoltei TaxID=1481888 RepID=A0AAU9K012_9CILI|nr:unnamed protein product [Blepharisma stoltei]
MVNKSPVILLVLLRIGFSSASSVFSPKDTPQFLPKIQAESSQFKEIYSSARVHIEINSMPGDMDDLLEDLEDSAYKASEILKQVLFVKPQTQPLKLGEKNLCKNIQLENYMKHEGIEADLAVFFSLSNNFIQNSTSFKVCEVSNDNQLKSIEIKVDRKIYKALNEDKKVSLLNKVIISAIFNRESEKYAKEIEESLDSLEYQPLLSTCASNCATCSTKDSCITCSDSVHMSSPPTCACPNNAALHSSNCVCNSGYYFSSNTVCSACSIQCETCSVSNTNCKTCIDYLHMSDAPACSCPANSAIIQGECVCNTGYFFNTLTVCSACMSNCMNCIYSATNCVACSDPTHMSAAPTCACPANSALIGGLCVCNKGYYYSSNTVCSICSPVCATCTVAHDVCSSCTDSVHSSGTPTCACPNFSTLTGGACVCNQGYYYSSNTVCSPSCPSNCGTCNSEHSCLTCIDKVHMSAAPACTCPSNSVLTNGICTCNDGFFYSSGTATACTACSKNCATCSNIAGNCLTCSDTTHMTAAPACACPALSVVNPYGHCACNDGYYFSANGQCSPCATQCFTCYVSDSTCFSCIDSVHMGNPPICSCPKLSNLVAGTCTCIPGYYFSSNTECSPCAPQCASCSNLQTYCGSCADTIHMTAAPTCACPTNGSLAGTVCVCNTGYYFSSKTVCSACQSNCASCDLNPNACDTCKDTTHMSAAPNCACPNNSALIGTTCVCNAGYFYSSNTVCSACQNNCQSCSGSSTNCLICIDSVHMSAAPLCACPANSSLNGNACQCNPGYNYNSSKTCSAACSSNCATCGTNPNSCNTCTDPVHMSAAPTCQCPAYSTLTAGICVCNPGYYYSSASCSQCSWQCATCGTDPNTCNTCIDTIHMSAPPACQCPAYSTLTASTCVCNPGYYYSSAYTCSQCYGNALPVIQVRILATLVWTQFICQHLLPVNVLLIRVWLLALVSATLATITAQLLLAHLFRSVLLNVPNVPQIAFALHAMTLRICIWILSQAHADAGINMLLLIRHLELANASKGIICQV